MQTGGARPPAQSVTVSNSTHGRMPWTAAASTTRGGNWLAISPSGGLLPGIDPGLEWNFLTVTVNPAGLATGEYTGAITVAAAGDSLAPPADNTPQTVEVRLYVGTPAPAAPVIALSPDRLSIDAVAGSGRVVNATLQVSNAGGGSLNWTAGAQTSSGGNWLSVTPLSGGGGAPLTISAATGALPPGTYSGEVAVSAAGAANSPRSLPVTFLVRGAASPALQVSPGGLTFSVPWPVTGVPPQRMEISNLADGRLNWRLDAATFNGGAWLTVQPGSGSTPSGLTVAVDAQGLPSGAYLGRITFTAAEAINSPLQIPVTLTVPRLRPVVENRGVVHAATFLPSLLAPGQILTVFGSDLGPREPASFTLDPETRKLPIRLGGTEVTFDGFPAPLFFASSSQINLQVPFEVAGKAVTRMVVSVEGLDPADIILPVAPAAPGLFTVDGTQAAALNQDGALNSPQNPAAPGSVLQMFLTGQGVLEPPLETGALAPTAPPFPVSARPVAVTMNGRDARVLFAGAAPGFAGLLQLNVEIPPGLTSSNEVNVALIIGSSPAGRRVTIAVR